MEHRSLLGPLPPVWQIMKLGTCYSVPRNWNLPLCLLRLKITYCDDSLGGLKAVVAPAHISAAFTTKFPMGYGTDK